MAVDGGGGRVGELAGGGGGDGVGCVGGGGGMGVQGVEVFEVFLEGEGGVELAGGKLD